MTAFSVEKSLLTYIFYILHSSNLLPRHQDLKLKIDLIQEPDSTAEGYQSQIMDAALKALRQIKFETEELPKADMWCHLGKVIVRGPDEGNFIHIHSHIIPFFRNFDFCRFCFHCH